ncbi:MAG: TIGR03619 family F420-dependent LLM class oxidoreductase [Myxococcota bacterium]|nr:TIGR03619 family F420-dependent LLM class oxidoreductase [Myxococcota bacterium]
MRFSYTDSMIDPRFFRPLAVAAEEAGYDSFALPDSICYPEVSDSKYPYTPDGNREFLDGKPFIEPLVLAGYLASATERLRFTTFVLKLPMRHPVFMAKQAASLAVITDNRFGFGVGVSPWPEDFQVVDVPWEGRGRRMDECMEIIRGLTRGEFFSYQGEFFDVPSIKITPAPTQPLPLLVGGHSKPALRRAARLGDGWMHAGGDPAELGDMLARLQALRKEYGREREPFEVHVISMDAFTPDGVRRLEDLGVTDVIVGFRNAYAKDKDTQTLDEKLAALRAYAENVIAKVG